MPELVGRQVGSRGYGLMNFTWRKDPIPHEQAFEASRAAINSSMNFWNGGDFYGTPEANSMTPLAAYFEKYPEDADKVVLSIKGGLRPDMQPDSSPEYIRRSLESTLAQLKGRKKLDIFECARRNLWVLQMMLFLTYQFRRQINRGIRSGGLVALGRSLGLARVEAAAAPVGLAAARGLPTLARSCF